MSDIDNDDIFDAEEFDESIAVAPGGLDFQDMGESEVVVDPTTADLFAACRKGYHFDRVKASERSRWERRREA
jgi:hypothetical protein